MTLKLTEAYELPLFILKLLLVVSKPSLLLELTLTKANLNYHNLINLFIFVILKFNSVQANIIKQQHDMSGGIREGS